MKRFKGLFPLTAALTILGCGGGSDDDADIVTVSFGAFKQECITNPWFSLYGMCPSIPSADGTDPASFSRGIEGFAFEWGYEHTVRYRRIATDTSLQDSFPDRYVLEEVVAKVPASPDMAFTLRMRASDPDSVAPLIRKVRDGLYTFYGTNQFECLDADVCASVDAAIANDELFLATFEFRPQLGSPIVMTRFICGEPNRTFTVYCGQAMGLATEFRLVDKFGQAANEFVEGDEMVFEATLSNAGSEDITFPGPICELMKFIVHPNFIDPEAVIWRGQGSSDNCEVSGVDDNILAAGRSKTVSLSWDQSDQFGHLLLPGPYRARIWFFNQPEVSIEFSAL